MCPKLLCIDLIKQQIQSKWTTALLVPWPVPGWQWRPVLMPSAQTPSPPLRPPPTLTLCPNMPLATAFNPSVSLDVIERVDGCQDWDACQYVRSSVLLPIHVCVKCHGSCQHTFCSDTPSRHLCCHSCRKFNFLGPKLLQATPHAGAFSKKFWTVALHLVRKTLHIIRVVVFLSLQSFWENNNGFPQEIKKTEDSPFPDLKISEGFSEGGVGMQRSWVCKTAMSMSFQWEGQKTFWAQITLWHWECYGLRGRSGRCGFPQRVTYMDKCFG